MKRALHLTALISGLFLQSVHPQIYTLRYSVPGFKTVIDRDTTIYGAGAGSQFRIVKELDASYQVEFSEITIYRYHETRLIAILLEAGFIPDFPTVGVKHLYQIQKLDLSTDYYEFTEGEIFGILTVPFKLINNGKVSPGATLGGFYGYKFNRTSIVGSFGLASIPTQDVETRLGFTLAGGFIFEPFKGFQIGLILGFDHLGRVWLYEDRGWASLAVGHAFTN